MSQLNPLNPSEIMVELARHLAADQQLQHWCRREFAGRPLRVQLGVDEANPPGPEDYPIVGIADVVEQRGGERSVQSFTVSLACGLVDERVLVDEELPHLRIYAGMVLVADLKHRIEAACFRLRPGGVAVRGEDVPVSLYPLFVGYTTIDISYPISSRRARQ